MLKPQISFNLTLDFIYAWNKECGLVDLKNVNIYSNTYGGPVAHFVKGFASIAQGTNSGSIHMLTNK